MKTFLYIALPILAVLGLMFGLSLSWTIYYGVTEHYLTFPRIWVIAAMMLAGLGGVRVWFEMYPARFAGEICKRLIVMTSHNLKRGRLFRQPLFYFCEIWN